MARNGSGTYSKVNTFTSGTTITAASHNANWDDAAGEITNSVAVDGQSTMTGPLKAASGTAAAPSITFGSDPDTGAYRSAGNEFSIAVGGSQVIKVSSAGLDVKTGTVLIAGVAAFPTPTAQIADDAVTYAKIQNVAASRLLGNPTVGATDPSEISLGAGLEFSSTTLVSTSRPPTTQVFTSGTSQTYTTPAGVKWIHVLCIGGGSGGAGGQNAVLSTAGGASSFSTLTANGGAGSSNGVIGAGGTASGGYSAIRGNSGSGPVPPGIGFNSLGGSGAGSCLGGGGAGTVGVGAAAVANSGGGGGGGAATNGTLTGASGAGGASGGSVRGIISPPSATYTYTVGAGGAGAAGSSVSSSSGSDGGAGAAGRIEVIEYY